MVYGFLDEDDDDMRDEEQLISVVTFYERIPQRRNNSNRFSFNRRRDTMTDDLADERPIEHGKNLRLKIKQMTLKQFKGNARKVHKVRYGATRARRVLSRPGTCTCIEPDERGLIKARLQHILEYAEEFLPEFKRLSANDECAAVWCRTGRWVTLQGASMLHIISASHVGSAMVADGVISQMTVTYVLPWTPGYVLVWVSFTAFLTFFPKMNSLLIIFATSHVISNENVECPSNSSFSILNPCPRGLWAHKSGSIRNFTSTSQEMETAIRSIES